MISERLVKQLIAVEDALAARAQEIYEQATDGTYNLSGNASETADWRATALRELIDDTDVPLGFEVIRDDAVQIWPIEKAPAALRAEAPKAPCDFLVFVPAALDRPAWLQGPVTWQELGDGGFVGVS